MERTGIVIIGRNEAHHLEWSLRSVLHEGLPCVYADCLSRDASLPIARKLKIPVVMVSGEMLTAAKARNTGFNCLTAQFPSLEYIQFLDGDCQLKANWIATAVKILDENPRLAAISGILEERYPHAGLFHRLAAIEWHLAFQAPHRCGGVTLFRASALRDADGFNDVIRAGEEPELCHRLRQRGWEFKKVELPMATHDLGHASWRTWCRRQMRNGGGALQVYRLHAHEPQPLLRSYLFSIALWTLAGPLTALIATVAAGLAVGFAAGLIVLMAACLGYVWQAWRIRAYVRRHGIGNSALVYSCMALAGKFPELLGVLFYTFEERFKGKPSLLSQKVLMPTGGSHS